MTAAQPVAPGGQIYLDVVNPVNDDYRRLLGFLRRKDLRVFRLLDFESSLSVSLPEPLPTYEKYKEVRRLLPLDRLDPYAPLSYTSFRWVLTEYELIMRDAKLIGRTERKQQVGGLADRYFSAAAGPDDGGGTDV